MSLYRIFETLTHAVEGSAPIAITASFTWGIMSILLSPCHLASIPLIIGFVANQGRTTKKTAFYLSAFFAFGILLTIALIGIITASLGKIAGNIGRSGNFIVAFVFFVIGLYLVGIINLPFLSASNSAIRINKKGIIAAFILGFLFGLALGPCTFAYMAPMLALVFKISSTDFLYSALLLMSYAIGHCSVIVFAGTSVDSIERYLNWEEKSKGLSIIKKACGGLLIICSIYLIVTAI
ncbi:MAG: cytochrome c biogenesis protein CcdA [Candidatus Omnitrophica bacterium]|nr:cytochrome c biogenesis protein CcdA [Candidatus Omnitrophota bacterium]